jgi:Holliday junction resolvasome RuvABC ATP-dependent DNA helicase subunit
VISNEAQDTLSKEIEPYLIIKGLIQRTSKGRILTEAGEKYLENRK